MQKIRVGAVRYLNTKPFLFGLHHHPILQEIDLVVEAPAVLSQMLISDELDLALIPVAATRQLPFWQRVGNYGIACDGDVASVCLFGDVPLSQMETVLLDYQSRTSVNLAKILLRDHWKRQVKLVDATGEEYRQQIGGTTGGVVIGDRALEQRKQSKYIYDLGAAWKDYTGLPFVFAAWIANKELPLTFLQKFDKSMAFGISHLDEVVKENSFPSYDLKLYYSTNIHFHLDERKVAGMKLFLEKLKSL